MTSLPHALLDDADRMRIAEAKYNELIEQAVKLRPGPLAERIDRETGVGPDAARLVVMAHHVG